VVRAGLFWKKKKGGGAPKGFCEISQGKKTTRQSWAAKPTMIQGGRK